MDFIATSEARIIRMQRERIDQLEEELRQIREVNASQIVFPREWKLSGAIARAMTELYRSKFVTTAKMISIVIGDPDCDFPHNIMCVQMCRLRKRMQPFGIVILSRRGLGYELAPGSREIIASALMAQEAQ